jgi:hypothetical protein
MSSDEGTHISMAAHEIVGAIERFCELADGYPKFAVGEAKDLYRAALGLMSKLDDVRRQVNVQR